jgi:phosphatidylglycerophosphate synthase
LHFAEFKQRARKTQYTNYMEIVFSRVSIRLSYLFAHTSITPNQLTVLATFIAILGAAMIQCATYYVRIMGIAVWYLGYVLDFCDGEIARYRNMQTEFGHWLDVVTDRLKDVSLFTAVTLLAVRESRSTTAVLAGLLALGGTMVYTYSVSARQSDKRTRQLSPDKFGNINYAVMAVLMLLNKPELFLYIVVLVTFLGLIFSIYSTWRLVAKNPAAHRSVPWYPHTNHDLNDDAS